MGTDEAKSRRARQIVERLALTPAELYRLIRILRVTLDTLDPDYRANVTAIARELERSRRTVYQWADRVLAAAVEEMRDIRVGRPRGDMRKDT
ncbi:MAG: helix-turn-helix domain-containing protein [Chloroflexia bacterium]